MNLRAKSILGLWLSTFVVSAASPVRAQPEFSLTQLPEGGGTGSEALAFHFGNDAPELTLVGRVLDGSGVWQAAVWTSQSGQVFVLDITFHDPSTDSGILDIGDFSGDGRADLIAGSQGGPGSELPKVWRLDESGSLGCTWCEDTVNLPAGSDSRGKISDINMPNNGPPQRFAGGWSAGADGVRKATVWEWDGSVWQGALIPELASTPAHHSVIREFVTLISISLRGGPLAASRMAAGFAENNSAEGRPVTWFFNDALGTWSNPTELPLLPGGSEGEVLGGTIDAAGSIVLVGSSDTNPDGLGPVRHAAYWQCSSNSVDCSLSGSWSVFDLPVPASLVHCRSYCYQHASAKMVGTCDDGAGSEVATLWDVDFGVTPAVVTVHDVNNLVSNLPADVTLTEAFAITGRGTVATGRIETGSAGAAAGVSGPHAFFLETIDPGIPAVTEWGLMVMTVLVLTAATVVLGRKRESDVAAQV